MTKPRRTIPRKQTRHESELQIRRNRAAAREQRELQVRYDRRVLFPAPDDEEGRYRP